MDVTKVLADLREQRQTIEETINQVRIEMETPLFSEVVQDTLEFPGRLVAAVTRQGVEHIGQCGDATVNGN